MMLISVTSGSENEVQRALTKRHEIYKLYSVSGRYDFCAMLTTESTQELDAVIDKLRVIKGVADTFSTMDKSDLIVFLIDHGANIHCKNEAKESPQRLVERRDPLYEALKHKPAKPHR